MPAPQKISLREVRALTAMLVEDVGPERVTMKLVADRSGVRAPSLYKHVADREALLALVRDDAIADISAELQDATTALGEGASVTARLTAHARGVRAYALRRPQAFALVFQPSNLPPAGTGVLYASIAPLMQTCAELAGPDHALEAARTLTAWLTGFISMENAAAFQLDGDIDAAFDFGISAIIAGIGR